MQRVLLEELQPNQNSRHRNHKWVGPLELDTELFHPGDQQKPYFEEVWEEDEQVPLSANFERDEAHRPEEVQNYRDEPWHGFPAESDEQESEHVYLVQPLIEALVVIHTAQVE